MMSAEADDARARTRSDESGEWLRTISSLPADSEAMAWDVTRVYRMSPVRAFGLRRKVERGLGDDRNADHDEHHHADRP